MTLWTGCHGWCILEVSGRCCHLELLPPRRAAPDRGRVSPQECARGMGGVLWQIPGPAAGAGAPSREGNGGLTMKKLIGWMVAVVVVLLLVSPVPSEARGHVFFDFTIPLGVGPGWWGPPGPYYAYPYYPAPARGRSPVPARVHPATARATARLLVLLPEFPNLLPVCQGMRLRLADRRPALDGAAERADAVGGGRTCGPGGTCCRSSRW